MKKKIQLAPRERHALEKLHLILTEQPGKKITIAKLLVDTGLGRHKAGAAFLQLYGETIDAFRRRQRYMYGCYLLAADEMPMKRIASLCGYSNKQNFITAFKKNCGVTPGQYQKNLVSMDTEIKPIHPAIKPH